jgi:hypothetical protein
MDQPFDKPTSPLEKILSYQDPLTCNVWILQGGLWNDLGASGSAGLLSLSAS